MTNLYIYFKTLTIRSFADCFVSNIISKIINFNNVYINSINVHFARKKKAFIKYILYNLLLFKQNSYFNSENVADIF